MNPYVDIAYELVKLAEQPDPVAAAERQRSVKMLQRRFRAIARNLDQHGAVTNPFNPNMKRIALDKSKLTPEQVQRLGFQEVLVAVPEKGQDKLKTFRHPLSNYHLHDHGPAWTVHKDRHSSLPMILERLRLQDMRATIPTPTGQVSDVRTPRTRRQGYLQSLEHLLGEGVPGFAGYLKSVIADADSTLDRTRAGMSSAGRRAMKRLVDYGPVRAELPAQVP